MIGFVVWSVCAAVFLTMGVYIYRKKKKPSGFWANITTGPVTDVAAYNRAVGKLWMVFAAVLFLLGTPLLWGENSGYVVITIIGTMFAVIGIMAFYILVIDRKYRQQDEK